MSDVVLIKPNKELYIQYKDMMDEWIKDGSRIAPWPLHIEYSTKEQFYEMIKQLDDVENGINHGDYASSTTYWLYDRENNRIIGASNLRHYLDEMSKKYWGHIGYGIRPSERGKGYGTRILKLTLEEAKKINLSKVWLGAYESNVGSWKLMEKCGATFYKIVYEEDTNLPIKKYWIDI